MYKIKTMNHISPYGLQKLEERGCVVGEDIQAPDGLILRCLLYTSPSPRD